MACSRVIQEQLPRSKISAHASRPEGEAVSTLKPSVSPAALPPTVLLLALLTPILCAAQAPDSGQILRQQESITSPRIDRLPPPTAPEPEILAAPEKGLSILVKSIIINGGETLESSETLQALVADAIGQTLDFTGLQQLAERIGQHLKAKGWLLAKAYLPKQDVTEGIIRINITQGRLESDQQGHSISIQHDPDTRIKDEVIHQRMRYVISGDTLQGDNLERTLLLLNDLPGIEAATTLEKGKQPGTSRLGVNIKEAALIRGNFSIEDFGNRYTGPWVGNLNINLNDGLGIGDQLTVGGTGAENLGQGRIAYALPVGHSGLQANARYSYLGYSIGREFSQLGLEGMAQSAGGGLSYPFIRSRAFSLWGIADYTHKAMTDSSLQVLTGKKQIDNGTLGFNGQRLDRFFGGGFNQFSYSATVGGVDLSGLDSERVADQSTAHTQGVYGKHNFSLARLQKLTDSLSFFSAANGQLANGNLTSAEKFILGGPTGIRAYPVGEASGDSGWVANFELRYDLPYRTDIGNLQLVGFFDSGHITLHEQRWTNDIAGNRNEYSLSGSGIGINFSHANNFAIRGTWAHTLGDNPGVNAAGNDSSGLHDDNRLLLHSMVYF
ncbi:MAG: BamA/TamA family outer membrane protein [Methylobacter sp.]|nr:BamA/TamA family outer membrane protein [Methylobacter sp.]